MEITSGKGTRKGTKEYGQVRMADDTKQKSAVTCLSRVLPSSSNAPNSHESATCLLWMPHSVLDPDPNWAPMSNTPAHSLSPLFFIPEQFRHAGAQPRTPRYVHHRKKQSPPHQRHAFPLPA